MPEEEVAAGLRNPLLALSEARQGLDSAGLHAVLHHHDQHLGAVLARLIGEGIGAHHRRPLGGGADDDLDAAAEVVLYGGLEFRLDPGGQVGTVDHEVAAGQKGAGVGEAGRLGQGAQLGHRDLHPADIDPAQQADAGLAHRF